MPVQVGVTEVGFCDRSLNLQKVSMLPVARRCDYLSVSVIYVILVALIGCGANDVA